MASTLDTMGPSEKWLRYSTTQATRVERICCAPNQHDVAEAVGQLVATPSGQRPDRVVVGQAFGSDAVNTAVAPIQRQVVEGLGLGALTAVKA